MLGFLRPARTAEPLETLIDRVAAGTLTLVDIRDAAELTRTGQAKGALHVPMVRLPMVADPRTPDHDPRLAPDRPVAIYCATGARSAMAARLLRRMGHAEVHNIGGLGDWVAAGGPCTR